MKFLMLLVCSLLLILPAEIFAKPPPWAPAHGYRNKHKERHYGETHPGRHIGIPEGRCNRETVGTILGGVLGGTVGSTVGNGDSRTVAIVAGTLIGIFVGKAIGRVLDDADRYCTGQTLEHAKDGHSVTWQNPETSLEYRVTPTNTYQDDGQYCREYISEIASSTTTRKGWGKACRLADGSWEGIGY